jgi:hypothetical protein
MPTVIMADAGAGTKTEEVLRKDSVQEEDGKVTGDAMDLDV